MNKCFAIQFVVLAAAVVGLRAFGAEKTEPEAKTDRVTIEDRGAAARNLGSAVRFVSILPRLVVLKA